MTTPIDFDRLWIKDYPDLGTGPVSTEPCISADYFEAERERVFSKVDVLHAPAYTAPFWAPVPVVLTIHDVSYHTHPEWYPYRRDCLRRAFYERSAHAATRIITVSRFSAGEIARAYGIDGARIAVAPLGVSRDLVEGPVGALPDQVRPPFVLHVGDVHLRRNLPVALAAVCQLRRRGGPRVSLVLAGVDRGVGDELRALAIREGEPDAVVLTGPVSEPQLRALYGGAVALVYPSRYEGFGLPLLDRKSTRLNSSHSQQSRMPSSA